MKPNEDLVTITDNISLIKKLIHELVLQPRLKALEWSKLTKQSPSLKIGYPGQHLASLIVGMEGRKTAARGHDIVDGSEVKSCSRVDASDKCKDCGEKLLRTEEECSVCSSTNIVRDKTSKWLFTIRSEFDLKLLTEDVKRVILVLADYPYFKENNFSTIRFQAFEIWTNSPRCKAFRATIEDYYRNVYLSHKEKDNAKTPAPQNFWPYDYRFYLCNPIKVFSCLVKNANTFPELEIETYVGPKDDRTNLPSEEMPTELIKTNEFLTMIHSAQRGVVEQNLTAGASYDDLIGLINNERFTMKKIISLMPAVNEALRSNLPLRLAKPRSVTEKYVRR